MPVFDVILPHVVPWVLVLSRLGGVFLFAPLLSSPALPGRVRLLVLLSLTGVVYPLVDPSGVLGRQLDLYSLAPVIAGEVLIGASLGLSALLPLVGVQLGGLLMGQQMGLGIAQILNPATDIQGDALGQMLFMMTMAGFVMVGGLEFLVGGVVHSFASMPLGLMTTDRAPLEVMVSLLTSGYVLAIRVAIPVLMIIFLENVAIGFIMKTVPSLNILNFGFPLRILIGVFVAVSALGFMAGVIGEELEHAMTLMESWVVGLGDG